MPKLLVFQHVAHEILGTLDPLIRESGCRIRYVNFGRSNYDIPELRNYDGLIVLGGQMNVDQVDEYPYLIPELEAIKKAITLDIPILGICLGSQLLAKALGAEITKNECKEIGWYDVMATDEGRADPLFSKFNKVEKLFQWHGDTFEIPKGAVHLATSEKCGNQAFRYGNKIYGLQFHLEVDEAMIQRWLVAPTNKKELEELEGIIDPDQIRTDTPSYINDLMNLSDKTFGEFINLFERKEKTHVLPSI